MPIIIRRQAAPEEAKPAAPARPALTQDDVRAMLARQAAVFDQQIKAAMTKAVAGDLASAPAKPNKEKQIVGWDFAVKYDERNNLIESISASAMTSAPIGRIVGWDFSVKYDQNIIESIRATAQVAQ
jgi:hypothetical protein